MDPNVKLHRADVDVLVPDGLDVAAALGRTTHLGIGAHQDDLELMALHGILGCADRDDAWFTGVTVTDGAGSPRSGRFAALSDCEMRDVRVAEQREAARLGRYGCQIQLMHPSATVKDPTATGPVDDLATILELARPDVVYLHNPADRHDTHVACCLRSIAALRRLVPGARPDAVYGCEVWGDLDWLVGADKVVLPLDDPIGLGPVLAAAFASQIAGGKRYDLAIQGRRLAHATFTESHAVDEHRLTGLAMDLSPLLADPNLDVEAFTLGLVDRLGADVAERITRMTRGG